MSGADHDELTLESEAIALSVVLGKGARVTSLVNRRDGRQWLRGPRGGARSVTASWGDRYTATDHFGWDEMLPSVDPCFFPGGPFGGLEVPDHGELWTADFVTLSKSSTSLRQRATSERFGYEFERELNVGGPVLRAEYSLEVRSSEVVPLLWALHPQFAMVPGGRVLLEGSRDVLLDTSQADAPREIPWVGDLVVERDVESGADRMIYVRPGDEVGGATLVDPSGSRLDLRWDSAFAPYLGLWLDHGRYTEGHVVAIEPTNGFFDELARAERQGRVGRFAPGEPVSWWVEVKLGEGERRG